MSPGELRLEHIGSTTPMVLRSFGESHPRLLWEQWLLPRAAEGAAILFSFYTCPLRYNGRTVVANHGIYEAISKEFSWWRRMRATPINRKSAQRADMLIANSQRTKADIIEYFGLPDIKIEVINPGPTNLFFMPQTEESINSEVLNVFGKEVPYIMFVGKLAKRRHVPNLIKAFAKVRKNQNLPHHLLIVGPNVNGIALDELAEEWGIAQAFEYYPYMDQDRLAKLYAGADVFVLPTVYEGLSRTMLEAMACGTAVLTVDHPTLAEIGPGAALSVPTPQVEDLARGMRALLTDRSLRETYEEKGLDRAKKFSMLECAKETMVVLDKVALASDRRFF